MFTSGYTNMSDLSTDVANQSCLIIGLETLGYMNILKLKLAVFIRLLKEESN